MTAYISLKFMVITLVLCVLECVKFKWNSNKRLASRSQSMISLLPSVKDERKQTSFATIDTRSSYAPSRMTSFTKTGLRRAPLDSHRESSEPNEPLPQRAVEVKISDFWQPKPSNDAPSQPRIQHLPDSKKSEQNPVSLRNGFHGHTFPRHNKKDASVRRRSLADESVMSHHYHTNNVQRSKQGDMHSDKVTQHMRTGRDEQTLPIIDEVRLPSDETGLRGRHAEIYGHNENVAEPSKMHGDETTLPTRTGTYDRVLLDRTTLPSVAEGASRVNVPPPNINFPTTFHEQPFTSSVSPVRYAQSRRPTANALRLPYNGQQQPKKVTGGAYDGFSSDSTWDDSDSE